MNCWALRFSRCRSTKRSEPRKRSAFVRDMQSTGRHAGEHVRRQSDSLPRQPHAADRHVRTDRDCGAARPPVYGGKEAWTDEIQRSLIIVVKY